MLDASALCLLAAARPARSPARPLPPLIENATATPTASEDRTRRCSPPVVVVVADGSLIGTPKNVRVRTSASWRPPPLVCVCNVMLKRAVSGGGNDADDARIVARVCRLLAQSIAPL